jgi:hypothetical protein
LFILGLLGSGDIEFWVSKSTKPHPIPNLCGPGGKEGGQVCGQISRCRPSKRYVASSSRAWLLNRAHARIHQYHTHTILLLRHSPRCPAEIHVPALWFDTKPYTFGTAECSRLVDSALQRRTRKKSSRVVANHCGQRLLVAQKRDGSASTHL